MFSTWKTITFLVPFQSFLSFNLTSSPPFPFKTMALQELLNPFATFWMTEDKPFPAMGDSCLRIAVVILHPLPALAVRAWRKKLQQLNKLQQQLLLHKNNAGGQDAYHIVYSIHFVNYTYTTLAHEARAAEFPLSSFIHSSFTFNTPPQPISIC
mmetsp:Transcript_19094/g.47195  ORF Transcript_19094/g.47195 Transcript_19094/m.47195 type:complete len:154 (-) Transcript_19094:144-605(-)